MSDILIFIAKYAWVAILASILLVIYIIEWYKAWKYDDYEDIVILHIIVIMIGSCLSFIFFMLSTFSSLAQPKEEYTNTRPTAGICRYMGIIQSEQLKKTKPDLDLVEAAIASVEASYVEEEVVEDEPTGEELLNTYSYFGYTPDDAELELWTQLVMDECGNTEPDEGIAAVADVVANRVRSERFPNTIRGVVYQTGQFQPVGDGTLGRFPITDRVRDICADCISEGRRYDYLFFTAGQYNPYCIPGEVIGNHYFGY